MLLLYNGSLTGMPFAANDDSVKNPLVAGIRAHYGFIIIHSKSIRNIRDSYPRGIELDISRHLASKKAWDFCNCYPRVGFSFVYWDFDNPSILGYGITATGYIEPFYFTQKKINLSLRMGMGIAYHNNPYHPETNPQNQSYSTYISIPIVLNIGLNYRVQPNYNLRLAVNYNHISNGGIKEPNKGINYPTANLGIDYSFKQIDFKERSRKKTKEPPQKKYRIDLTYLSSSSNAIPETKLYYIYGLSGKVSRWVGRLSWLTLGSEWVKDGSRKRKIARDTTLKGIDYQRGAILAGHEFLLGRVIFSQQLGIYYYDPYKTNDPVYQRYGLVIRVTNRIFAGINLKAHRHVADFIDFRVGVSFSK